MGPYTGKRVPLEGLLYPRYNSVEELLGGHAPQEQLQEQTTAPKDGRKRHAEAEAVALTAASPSPAASSAAALFAAAEAAAAAGMDPEAVAVLQRKAAKRAKREQRQQSATPAQQPAEQPQVPVTPATAVMPAQTAARQARRADTPKQEAVVAVQGEGLQAQQSNATQPSNNADEAAKIRATLGYSQQSAAPAKPATASAAKGSFSFGFSVAQQVEADTEAKIARIMTLDSTKDGFVPRKVWACGMPHEYSEQQVREYWEECGEVEALDLFTFKDSTRFNGAAFITFKTQEAYEAALAANGEELEGRKLRVEKCKVTAPKKTRAGAGNSAPAATIPAPSPQPQPQPQQPIAPAAVTPAPAAAPATTPAAAEDQSDYNVAYVGNIAFEAGQSDLEQMFKPYGATLIRLHTDKKTEQHKGYAHVHFTDVDSLAKALSLNGNKLHGRSIKVLKAAPPKTKA